MKLFHLRRDLAFLDFFPTDDDFVFDDLAVFVPLVAALFAFADDLLLPPLLFELPPKMFSQLSANRFVEPIRVVAMFKCSPNVPIKLT